MTEQELRALVREAVERHLGRPVPRRGGAGLPDPAEGSTRLRLSPDASHGLLHVLSGSESEDGACVIEPPVRCSHCRFCQSYGH
jgi:hypothetical protein